MLKSIDENSLMPFRNTIIDSSLGFGGEYKSRQSEAG
jgi:hypothetical protein